MTRSDINQISQESDDSHNFVAACRFRLTDAGQHHEAIYDVLPSSAVREGRQMFSIAVNAFRKEVQEVTSMLISAQY